MDTVHGYNSPTVATLRARNTDATLIHRPQEKTANGSAALKLERIVQDKKNELSDGAYSNVKGEIGKQAFTPMQSI